MSKLRQIHDRKDIILFEFVTYFLRFITVFDEIWLYMSDWHVSMCELVFRLVNEKRIKFTYWSGQTRDFLSHHHGSDHLSLTVFFEPVSPLVLLPPANSIMLAQRPIKAFGLLLKASHQYSML